MLVILHLVLPSIALSFEMASHDSAQVPLTQRNTIRKEKAFEFEVSCDAQISANDCNAATQTIQKVGVLIAAVLKIVVPIKA